VLNRCGLANAIGLTSLAALTFAACDKFGNDTRGSRDGSEGRAVERSEQGLYRETVVTAGGSVSGVVVLVPDRDRPTVALQSHAGTECHGVRRSPPAPSDGGAMRAALVWLVDVQRGKPLPTSRRFTIENRDCLLYPAVQAAIASGTLNVKNSDTLAHRTRFVDAATGEIIETVRQTDAGQIVPIADPLRKPGLVELRCDLHPWTRAWIHVFAHPYFVETVPEGAFRIDSIPPGRYRLVVWHPDRGSREQEVDVRAGEQARIELRL
jgi:hypothetical protein